MSDARKEFVEWLKTCPLNFTPTEQQAGLFAWQACQSLNDRRIAQLEAELAEAQKDLLIAKLVKEKMQSGNDVPVTRCVITKDEIDQAINQAKETVSE